jgi:hypothetical protein
MLVKAGMDKLVANVHGLWRGKRCLHTREGLKEAVGEPHSNGPYLVRSNLLIAVPKSIIDLFLLLQRGVLIHLSI